MCVYVCLGLDFHLADEINDIGSKISSKSNKKKKTFKDITNELLVKTTQSFMKLKNRINNIEDEEDLLSLPSNRIKQILKEHVHENDLENEEKFIQVLFSQHEKMKRNKEKYREWMDYMYGSQFVVEDDDKEYGRK